MSNVICNSIGSTPHCRECGASKPHYFKSCEPCPINKKAHCIDIFQTPEDLQYQFTHIEIIKITKKVWVGKFLLIDKTGRMNPIETEYKAESPGDLKRKIQGFLKVELKDEHFIIPLSTDKKSEN